MSLGRSKSILSQRGPQQLQRHQAQRDAAVVRLKKELAGAVEYAADDPALPIAVARLAAKGRVAGIDYDVRDLPRRQCVLMLPVGHRNIEALTSV